ncbi:MAG: beta-ketoacyl-[acyl-carrier-protein] synthase family protein [Myxococcota bacterium]|nr:beta-ketoacyl-[acyl-carrier-protein] synthase family protein [Myxococcota bacterium]
MRPRVAVTAVGVACAVGDDARESWQNLLAGRDGVGPLVGFDTSKHRTHVAAQSPLMKGQRTHEHLAVRPFEEAWAASGRNGHADAEAERIGLAVGILGGEALLFEEGMLAAPGERKAGLSEESVPWLHPDRTARTLAHRYGIAGPVATLANACSAGNHAIAAGCDWIRSGSADVVMAGGFGHVSFTSFTHFDNLRALSPDVCRPFDLYRRGLVMGDGAAWLVLEELEYARRRGATVLAEVLGYGISCDAHHVAAPHPQGRGAIAAMREALRDARLDADAVDYVSAHGTATRANDPVEAAALHEVLGERAARVPCSSIKSMIGHTMGAASAIEAFVCCRAIEEGEVPPTIHHDQPDPACNIDCVPNEAREIPVRVALNNSYAFGGNNCTVVFGALQ